MIEVVKYLICTAGGVAIGYFIAHQRLEQRLLEYYNERADKAEEEAKDFYRRKYEKKFVEEVQDQEFVQSATDAAEALQQYQGVSMGPSVLVQEMTAATEQEEAVEETDPVEQAERKLAALDSIVPTQPTEPVNYNRVSTPDKELTTAEKEAAYVPVRIKKDEFVNHTSGFAQFSVTYFSGDDILADEYDAIVSEETRKDHITYEIMELLKAGPEAMGGETNLFIRNERIHAEFDIVWSSGKYVDEVGPITASG